MCRHVFLISNRTISTQVGGTLKLSRYEGFEEPMKFAFDYLKKNYMHEMDIEWFCGNEWKRKGGMGRYRALARRIERIVIHR